MHFCPIEAAAIISAIPVIGWLWKKFWHCCVDKFKAMTCEHKK